MTAIQVQNEIVGKRYHYHCLDKNGEVAYKHTGYNAGDEYSLEEELAGIAED